MEQTDNLKNSNQNLDKYLKAKKFNSKIFPIYKMFSWDLLFYYSISFLFLTQAKGLSASNVLLLDAFYRVFQLLSQIPSINISEILGKRKSLIIANISIAISILILLLSQNLTHVIISQIFMGFGYSLKELCDSVLLRSCITAKEHPGTAFSNIDGKGSAYYYFFDAITSISCGFLFVFNNYLPMVLCFLMCMISTILAFAFKKYEDNNKSKKLNQNGSYIQYFKDLKVSFKIILKSQRLKSLFLFTGFFAAILSLRSTISTSLLAEIGIKEQYFGIITAILQIIAAISSKHQDFFHKKFKNKVLTYFSLLISGSFIIAGLVSMFSKNFAFIVCIVLIMYVIQHIIKGPYLTLRKRYLNNFASSTIITKIYSANNTIECLFSAGMCYFASLLLDFANSAITATILGCIFFIIFIFILDYMKDRIGLKPEEYKKSDIEFKQVH